MKITKRNVESQAPSNKAIYLWDGNLSGFGLKILPSGRKTYLVQYRMGGRKGRTRRMTIGVHGTVTTEQARREAKTLLAKVSLGIDPLADKDKAKQAPTTDELLQKFLTEYVDVKLGPRTQVEYHTVIRLKVPKAFRRKYIHEITRRDVAQIHQSMSDMPTRANKTIMVLSKFFNWCEENEYRDNYTNPCRHVKKYKEEARQRFLSQEEQERLKQSLITAENDNLATPYAIESIRMLMFTGARLREILDLKWSFINWELGVLSLPKSKTGAKTIYLNPQALEVLKRVLRQKDNPYVFCGVKQGQPIINLQKPWRRIRSMANLDDVRLHDLRHTFASVAVMNGMSLPIVGALLGHSKPQTTARYAHLASDPLLEAAELIGRKIAG